MVELIAFVQHGRSLYPVSISVAGDTPVAGLSAAAMSAVARQHPQHIGRPIATLRLALEARK